MTGYLIQRPEISTFSHSHTEMQIHSFEKLKATICFSIFDTSISTFSNFQITTLLWDPLIISISPLVLKKNIW